MKDKMFYDFLKLMAALEAPECGLSHGRVGGFMAF
jgi:hypothetical protein